jgi:hypothetical protein
MMTKDTITSSVNRGMLEDLVEAAKKAGHAAQHRDSKPGFNASWDYRHVSKKSDIAEDLQREWGGEARIFFKSRPEFADITCLLGKFFLCSYMIADIADLQCIDRVLSFINQLESKTHPECEK